MKPTCSLLIGTQLRKRRAAIPRCFTDASECGSVKARAHRRLTDPGEKERGCSPRHRRGAPGLCARLESILRDPSEVEKMTTVGRTLHLARPPRPPAASC